MNAQVRNARLAGLVSCRACGLLCRMAGAADSVPRGHCPRCGVRLVSRHPHAIQRAWAFAIAAAICLGPANILPVLTTNEPGASETNTILGGVVSLYSTGSWFLALIVLVASIVIPVVKLAALAHLLVGVQRGWANGRRDRTRLFRAVEFIGRWSMLDVFVVAFVAAIVQLEPILSAQIGPGMPYFAAVVILTMLAARAFDPRLIWDVRDGDGCGGPAHG